MKSNGQTYTGAIIVAAGASQRMAGIDKLWAPLGGKPLIARVVDVFQACRSIDQIVIVLNQSNLESGQQLAREQEWSKVTDICLGGQRRQDSAANGLARLSQCQWVVIHDGARPLVTEELIESGLETVTTSGAAAAAVPVTDTIKIAGNDRLVTETPPRQNLWAVQTPQVFQFDIIAEAYRRVTDDVTDDATMVERIGHRVQLYMGSYDNIKITKAEDLALASILWQKHAE